MEIRVSQPSPPRKLKTLRDNNIYPLQDGIICLEILNISGSISIYLLFCSDQEAFWGEISDKIPTKLKILSRIHPSIYTPEKLPKIFYL